MCSVSVMQVKIAQGGAICMFPSGPIIWQTGCASSVMICLGASNFTPSGIGCSSLKKDLFNFELPVCEIVYGF